MAAETSSGNKIIALALSANDGTLIALTDTFQLMTFNMKEVLSNVAATGKSGVSHAPVNISLTKNEFSVFSYPFHCGSITGVDVCQRKPLVVTCGADRSVRVWNYLTMELELSKEFEENVESVALHPTGEYLIGLINLTFLNSSGEVQNHIVKHTLTYPRGARLPRKLEVHGSSPATRLSGKNFPSGSSLCVSFPVTC